MVEDVHDKAVAYLVSKCPDLAVVSVLAYGSYARGDYRSDSDVDLLVVLDSGRYSVRDLKGLIDVGGFCRKEFKVNLQMDVIVDSEIDLWNRGVLLEGHSFIDLAFYRKEGRVLYGEDVRSRFKLPGDLREKSLVVLGIIEVEFKRWFLEGHGEDRLVPHWMTGWLLATLLNVQGTVEVTSFKETCRLLEKVPAVASTMQFKKYREKCELTADEFIGLLRTIKSCVV